MKKVIPVLFCLVLLYGCFYKEEILIPDYAIRFRVIASSNTLADQEEKIQVKNEVEAFLNSLMANVSNSREAEAIILDNLDYIKEIVANYNLLNTVVYGDNYFPEKTYKGVTYPSGSYKSLVITLGEGDGDNFWCVMFPPLCLLDASDNENVEYSFYVKELLNKYSS